MAQHPNSQPPMEKPLLKLDDQFCDFFNQRRVVGNFLILFIHNVFIPWYREINKGPLSSHPIQHGNIWTIMFQFPRCFDTLIPPDLNLPILRHSNLILNLLVLYISRLDIWLARIYDLLGVIPLTVVEGKHIYREACDGNNSCDLKVSTMLAKDWLNWTRQLRNVRIPRK